ncbi:glyoxalase domain-containing protein 4 isoform X2 [Lampetra planeri]
MALRRALHFVFKVGDRGATLSFYRQVLGMQVLRHEEFKEGCKATCNGPYDGTWSKTMIGYGPEDDHFVVELTYNYGIGTYRLGNDFLGMTIQSSKAVKNARQRGWPMKECDDGTFEMEAPGGYKFFLIDKDEPKTDPVQKVSLGVSDLQRSLHYWEALCGMKLYKKEDGKALLGFADSQLPDIQSRMQEENQKVITPLVSLDTPGKATVEVVIVADPDDHEICFVGDEAFRELSKPDPGGDSLLNQAIAEDKSGEWYAKHKRQKPTA